MRGRSASFTAAAGLFGFLWGAVAARTGSLRRSLISHSLTDFAGLGARIYLDGQLDAGRAEGRGVA